MSGLSMRSIMPVSTSVNSPNYSSGDEEEDGSEQEGEALHEVQSGWVKGVEDAAADQKT